MVQESQLQRAPDGLLSVGGRYVLRACIVNFHTTQADVEAVPDIIARVGPEVDAELRPAIPQPGSVGGHGRSKEHLCTITVHFGTTHGVPVAQMSHREFSDYDPLCLGSD